MQVLLEFWAHHFRTVESDDLETDVLKQLTTFFMTSKFCFGPFYFIDHRNIYTIKIMLFNCPKPSYLPTNLPLPLQIYLQAYPSYPIDLGSEVNS
jgi:hypothetical protein